jgi:hypothetical protein
VEKVETESRLFNTKRSTIDSVSESIGSDQYASSPFQYVIGRNGLSKTPFQK